MTIAIGNRSKDLGSESILDAFVEAPGQLHVVRERVSNLDRPGSIIEVIKEYQIRVGVEGGQVDGELVVANNEASEVRALTRTARLMGALVVGMGAGGLACGLFAGVSIDGQMKSVTPEAGVAVIGCFSVLLGTLGYWVHDRLPHR